MTKGVFLLIISLAKRTVQTVPSVTLSIPKKIELYFF